MICLQRTIIIVTANYVVSTSTVCQCIITCLSHWLDIKSQVVKCTEQGGGVDKERLDPELQAQSGLPSQSCTVMKCAEQSRMDEERLDPELQAQQRLQARAALYWSVQEWAGWMRIDSISSCRPREGKFTGPERITKPELHCSKMCRTEWVPSQKSAV